jgi:PhzF family phenazine biosynthesis protein
MHIHRLICFGARPGAGNPALVIEDGPLDADARQALTREHGTTCVFVDENAGDGAIPRIDYFYPHMRSPLCLHATLAVAAVLFARPGAPAAIEVETAMKGQRLALLREGREGGDYFVRLAPQPVPAADVSPALLKRLLGAPGMILPSSARVASVGSPKLLVQVRDVDALYALAPDLAAIAAWGRENGVNGIYAWCERPDGDHEGRNFNHLDPGLEDSATGVAAGALCVALGRSLALHQGRATGRDCLIRTRFEGTTLLVGGAAEPGAIQGSA